MDLTTYEKITKSEQAARRYLLGFCWENHQRFCPKCKNRKVYNLAEKRKRCSRCGYTFHDFSRRFINVGNLNCRQWIRLLKLFELDVPPIHMPDQLGMASNTVYKAVNTLRMSILAHCLDAPIFLKYYGWELGFPGIPEPEYSRGKSDFSPVFGVIKKGGKIFVDYLPHLDESDVLHFKANFYLKTAKLGNIVYTDSYKQYETLIFYEGLVSRHHNISHRDKGLAVEINKDYWPATREKIKRLKGVMPHKFPLYLKEIEFRYNVRDKDLLETLAGYMCSFVPKFE